MAGNENIFLGSGASLVMIPEHHIEFIVRTSGNTANNTNEFETQAAWRTNKQFIPNLYVGCIMDIYQAGVLKDSLIIASNTATQINTTTSTAHSMGTGDVIRIRKYGAPSMGILDGTNHHLNADNFLGLIESATFPQVEQEMKQMNLALGGTRNITHQYRGIRSSSGGSLNYIIHSGAMLYYALGKCTNINAVFHTHVSRPIPTDMFTSATVGDIILHTKPAVGTFTPHGTNHQDVTAFNETGPFFYKTKKNPTNPNSGSAHDASQVLVPPILNLQSVEADFSVLKIPANTTNPATNLITYTFEELDTSELPSFSLEQNIAKDPNELRTDSTDTDVTESRNFVRIARGNRIASMTISASEGEEMKMTAELNTRAVESIRRLMAAGTTYQGRAGVEDNAQLFNWNGTLGTDMAAPFFFSAGTFSILGEPFAKMSSLNLTINNNLIDKRYMGGHRDIKEALAAQRTYEIQGTAVVTDDALFNEIFVEAENIGEAADLSDGLIQLKFTKDNTEEIVLEFKNYFIDTANWTIPDDKGPVTVEFTVRPRNLHRCTVKTGYVLQG